MKNTTKILAITIATAILTTGTLTTLAMGNGNGQGQGMGKGQGQFKNTTKAHSPADMLVGVATGSLSEEEKNNLLYQYSEEMLARDLYNHFYELYGVKAFQNIANSEQKHMDAVKVLLDRYGVLVPTGYGELQDEFNTLKAEGELSLQKALEVGIKAEILDITDITNTIKTTDNDDIKIVFTNIGGASYNHLRGFAKGLANAGLTTQIDFSQYLSSEEISSTGTLKHKLSEKLTNEGIVLPAQASPEVIKANCVKKEANKQKLNGNGNGKGYGKDLSEDRKVKMQDMKNKYKKQISDKYGKSLQKMNPDKLNTLSQKIDEAMLKIQQDTTLADTLKDKYMSIYASLKEVVDSINLN